ncbi:MAG: hypothetical protein J6R18_04190 [Kiritimatiellae bacterium]|nr:hypothetical protein [Kiritimatiellia bacterium]
MSKDRSYDFMYAAQATEVLHAPTRALETFGTTCVNYHLLAELEDYPGKIRIREGRLQASKPEIITPERYVNEEFEGFGEMAKQYYDFLKQNEDSLKILKYGYRLKQEAFSEQIVTDSMDAVAERVVSSVKAENKPFDVVIKGVDDPWDVCLMQFFWLHTNASVSQNMRDFKNAGMFK